MQAPEFWQRDGYVPRLLSPAGALWHAGAVTRRAWTTPQGAGAPVVCVGNIVAGGAGKTPVASAVGAALARRGAAPHFLSRGYGGSVRGPIRVDRSRHGFRDVGDEPLLLDGIAPVWIARDRLAGARAAVAAGAGILVMDDGFQNFSLQKDFSLLVVDGPYGMGNGRLIPAGPLREPPRAALARADAVVLVGEDRFGIERNLDVPVLAARFRPTVGSDRLAGMPVLAFAGLGRPEKFFETLSGMGCKLVATHRFPDHHPYAADEVMRLVESAAAAEATAVTTEKDLVRLPPEAQPMVECLRVELEWRDPDIFDHAVATMLGAGT